MSSELINRITIKKSGVYVNTHSSNDTAPYHSVKIQFLTDKYLSEGQKGIDRGIIEMCFNNCMLKGSHESVLPYINALDEAWNKEDFINIVNEETKLEDNAFDIANRFGEYKNLTKEESEEKYNQIKPKLEEIRNKKINYVVDIIEKYREKSNNYMATAIMMRKNEKPFSINVVRGTKENVEESLKHFKDTYKDTDIKIVNINVRKEEDKNILEDIVEKYNNKLDYGLENTPNGNFIFPLKDVVENETEQEIFTQILEADSRLSDLEIYEEDGEGLVVDLVAYLDFCHNAETDEEEYEDE